MEALRQLVGAMLREKAVTGVLSFVSGPEAADNVPCFITEEDGAGAISTDTYPPFSLAKMVAKQLEKGTSIGVVLRTCDARALVELAKRQQVDMEAISVIGIECPEEGFGHPWCRRCEHLVPTMADVAFYLDGTASANTLKGKDLLTLIDAQVAEKRETSPEARARAIQRQRAEFAELETLGPGERLEHWSRYLDRCIKCYGCRNSCPICFCKDCYLQPHKLMVKPGGNPPDRLFHLVRLMHVGDSCVNCGQCEAGCPMGIPISTLYHALQKELAQVFGYEPGMDMASMPPLGMIAEEDLTNTGVELA